jgi:TolB-like protein/DNA-binding winged helix-turn-helix (wHTH) protein/Tfp pilus assembly protein PilF
MTPHRIYSFDDFTLDLTSGSLRRGGRDVRLRPKAFALLKFLVENPGRLVSKDELIAAVWPGTFVTDDALLKRMKDLREALDDEGRQYIRTVPWRGYVFAAAVKVGDADDTPRTDAAIESQRHTPGAFGHLFPNRLSAVAATSCVILAVGVLVVAGVKEYRQRSTPVAEASPAIHSIAVLPLDDLTDDPANEYFSDGMTESLITALSRVQDLKVVPRGSVMRFKGAKIDPGDAGRQLGVAAVVEGSVRKSAEWVRVAVRLVSVEDGRVLWARDTRERLLGDIFALQDEIARGVVAELRLNLDSARVPQLARKHTDNIEAYQAYLKGRYFWNKRTESGLLKGIEYFQQAIQADRRYALAYVGLADSYLVLKSLSLITPQQAHEQVEPALMRALAIDDTLGEAHASLAWASFAYAWNWPEAERQFRRAIELQPNDATTHQWYAEFLSAMGRHGESLAEIRRAQQLDPPSPIINVIAAQVHFFARQYDQAIDQSRKTLELDAHFYIAHDYLGWALNQKGMYKEALAAVQQAQAIEDTPLQLCEVGQVHAAAGDRERAQAVLRDVIARSRQLRTPRHAYRIARIHAALRDADAAFSWLERAFAERDEMLVWLKVDPHFDNLRPDSRFARLLQRIGFAIPLS